MYSLLSFTNARGQVLVRSRAGFSIVFTTIQNVTRYIVIRFLETIMEPRSSESENDE